VTEIRERAREYRKKNGITEFAGWTWVDGVRVAASRYLGEAEADGNPVGEEHDQQ
jgi:hypothetical protein